MKFGGLIVLLGVSCLVLASSAAAAPNVFSATVVPTAVKPLSSSSYTIKLVNGATSTEADHAKITIPPGFVVRTPVSASASGGCGSADWEPDGELISGGKINLKWPGGNDRLCPNGTLTISFTATAPASEAIYT